MAQTILSQVLQSFLRCRYCPSSYQLAFSFHAKSWSQEGYDKHRNRKQVAIAPTHKLKGYMSTRLQQQLRDQLISG
jgi:hypothetical protein